MPDNSGKKEGRSAARRVVATRTVTKRPAKSPKSKPRGTKGAKPAPSKQLETIEDVSATIRHGIDGEVVEVAIRLQPPAAPHGSDIGAVFAEEVRHLLGDAVPDSAAIRRAARLAVAEQAWEQRIGALLETRDVVELLGISKQRISTLTKSHRLIALPQEGGYRYPAWQFAVPNNAERECLASAHRVLVDEGAILPWSAASWFLTEHPELRSLDPVSWLRSGGACNQLLTVATRDAARAAQ